MTEGAKIVLGSASAEDDLRLPRAPGVIRAFWARHPRLADVALVIITLLFAGPTFILGQVFEPPGPAVSALILVLMLITALCLLWRRRHPLIVLAVAASPLVLTSPDISGAIVGLAPTFAIYAVAVYRSNRAALWALGITVAANAAVSTAWMVFGSVPAGEGIPGVVGNATMLLVGTLVGTNVGSRKRYVEALIDRSRQLARERDQQAELAAAAERTRIAREMHDIVSHSLAVVVTLAEGAHATHDASSAKQANRAIADTARDALDQMRVMLGVLREAPGSHEHSDRMPLLGSTPEDIIKTAVAAGVPVSYTVKGTPSGTDLQRLAVRRIVQEGLTNVMRYAPDATWVRVESDYAGDTISVSIGNDGVKAAAPSLGSGLGLQGLAERVAALGGEFEAGPTPAGHWRLSAQFPKQTEPEGASA
ncbi:MAG: histidine kinase [Agrococcus casei]|uniref:sensor histidine kinase n=2 Tax=Agrococcus casei TaxID=343512 RepID=UPI003F973934